MFISGQQTGIGDERQIAQNFGQVTRTDLTGSTRALNCFRQTDTLFFFHLFNLKINCVASLKALLIFSIEAGIFQQVFGNQ